MEIKFDNIVKEVMARLGEVGSGDEAPAATVSPTPYEAVAGRVRSLLPEVAERLLREAPLAMLGAGEVIPAAAVTLRRMPCGEMAAELPLPEPLVRVVSIKMACWEREVCDLTEPGTPGWECQWSREAGIAGTLARPRAYLGAGYLRLVGVSDAAPAVTLRGWQLPTADTFPFPHQLYPSLLSTLTQSL